jgi:hypothetical protein
LVHCFAILSCRSSSSLVFYPFEIHEVMVHGLRKTLQIVSSLHFGRLALQSQIVRNQNLVLFFSSYFDGIYIGRGLGIACNTLRLLVFIKTLLEPFFFFFDCTKLVNIKYLKILRGHVTCFNVWPGCTRHVQIRGWWMLGGQMYSNRVPTVCNQLLTLLGWYSPTLHSCYGHIKDTL